MQRREILKMAAYGASALATRRAGFAKHGLPSIPIIDSHIHLFDTSRASGVPWPEKDDTALYKPALPERYEAMSAPFGVVGAIAVEASPLASDNDWLLDVVQKHPLIVGIIGDLIPGSSAYVSELDRLHTNTLFRGIRYGNIWNRDLVADMDKPGFMDGLKYLSQAGLVFESANPDPRLVGAILEISQRIPELRIVIDHLPHSPIPTEEAARKQYEDHLSQLSENHNVFVKLSEIPVVHDGKLVKSPEFYRAPLDAIWSAFGDDRIIFGSDWPNSDHVAPFADTLAIVHAYISEKSHAVQEKYFWKNSMAAYRWQPRKANQPGK